MVDLELLCHFLQHPNRSMPVSNENVERKSTPKILSDFVFRDVITTSPRFFRSREHFLHPCRRRQGSVQAHLPSAFTSGLMVVTDVQAGINDPFVGNLVETLETVPCGLGV
eukprot:Blabericola_migrator_1__12997@NODE_867_length_6217_cov_150_679024_g478_i2_p2_GENE_NODE_867_length_6217_cov_150_679024_g478_i2NODE_867_length_6217_cov_150_679024_g478_i2_p2_ORF_typecomplete_len111_score19_38_NODE_867_length_6217_cov_150_679024_g478_i244764808